VIGWWPGTRDYILLPTVTEPVEDLEEQRFTNVITNDHDLLYYILAESNKRMYNL